MKQENKEIIKGIIIIITLFLVLGLGLTLMQIGLEFIRETNNDINCYNINNCEKYICYANRYDEYSTLHNKYKIDYLYCKQKEKDEM